MSRVTGIWVIRIASLVLLTTSFSCTPEQWVIQHGASSMYSHSYKYVGIRVPRANVRVRGWDRDSVAIAVSMLQADRSSYSFVIDSLDDSLLLLGESHGVVGNTSGLPEAIVDVPHGADISVETAGNVSVQEVDGPIRIDAMDSATVAAGGRSPVLCGSGKGFVTISIATESGVDLDVESGSGGTVVVNSTHFHGSRSPAKIKGTWNGGGPKIMARGAKGVNVEERAEP